MPVALPQVHRNSGYGRRNKYRRSKLQYLHPVPAEWNRLIPDNFVSKIAGGLNFTKFRPDRVVTTCQLAQPLCKFWIAVRARQCFSELWIRVVNRAAIKQQLFFGFVRVHSLRGGPGFGFT